ncbi:MAG: hypothetical protein D6782_09215, partial [Alphaproteobacteria bacterium]
MSHTAVITGLLFEARLIARAARRQGLAAPMPAIAAGGSAERASQAARRLADQGAGALLSFGIGGGLDARLAPGDLVIASAVYGAGKAAIDCDSHWAAALAEATGARRAPVLTSQAPVATALEKARLFEDTGAALVDMESHG